MGFSLRKLGEDIFSVLGNAGNQAQQVLGNAGHAIQQAPQQLQQAVQQAPQQIQRNFIQPQANFVQRNVIQPVVPVARTMGSINRGIGIGINQGIQQSNNMMRPFAQPINNFSQDLFMPAKIAKTYDLVRKKQYFDALQNQTRVPILSEIGDAAREQAARSLGNQQAFGVTAQQIREPGFANKAIMGGGERAIGAVQNVPGIKQGINFRAPLSLMASAYGTPGAMVAEGARMLNIAPKGISPREVGGFVNENMIKPIVKSGADIGEFQQGANAAGLGYTNNLQGAAKFGSDIYNVGSLVYTGAKAAQLSAAAKPSLGLVANVAGRQFAAGSSANVMNQLAQGKKINEINPLEAVGAGAAYAALGTGLPMAGKMFNGLHGSAAQTAIANAAGKTGKNIQVPNVSKAIAENAPAPKIENATTGGIPKGTLIHHGNSANPNDGNLLGMGRYGSTDKKVAEQFGPVTSTRTAEAVRESQVLRVRSQAEEDALFKKANEWSLKQNGTAPGMSAISDYAQSKGYHAIVGSDGLDNLAGINVLNARVWGKPKVSLKGKPALETAPNIPKELQPLAAEARKYKSAEEFVKAQGTPAYHGTGEGVKFDKFDATKAEFGNRGKQIYLTENQVAADWFSKLKSQTNYLRSDEWKNGGPARGLDFKPNTKEFIVPKNAKIKVLDSLPQQQAEAVIAKLKKQGYDGVRFTDDVLNTIEGQPELAKAFVNGKHPATTIMFNPDKLQTRSQLTDLYNQATGKGTMQSVPDMPQLPKGYKMTAAGDVVDSTGRKLTTGEIQQLTQPKALTQAEKLVNSGRETVAQTQGLENKLGGSIPKDQYLYHGTNTDVLNNISTEGLKPMRRGLLSLSKDEAYAKSFAREGMTPQGKTGSVMLRVKSSLLEGKTINSSKPRPASDQLNEILAKGTIAPKDLEIKVNGKWQPLQVHSKPIYETAPKPSKPLGSGSGNKKIGDLYEAQTTSYFKDRGYNVTPVGKLKGALDNGIDVQATKGKELLLIQNKVRGEGKDVHLNTAALLWANAEKARKANPGKTVRPIIFTTEKLDTNATNFAKSKGIEIVHTPMPGAKASNGVDNELYRMASQRIGQNNVDNALRDMPVKQRADALFQLSNPDSTLSKGLKDQSPQNFTTIIHNYYKAVDSEGTAQYGALQGISQKLKYADTPEQVKSIIQKEYAAWQKNVPAGTKNPLLEGLLGKLDDQKFLSAVVKERNAMKLSRIVDNAANLEPISAKFERPRGMRVSMKKDLPNDIPLESTPKTMTSGEYGNKPFGYNKTVANSRFTSEPTKVALEATAPTRGVLSNKQIAAQAREMVMADTNTARQYADKNSDALSEAISGYLIKHYNDTGDIGNATGLAISQAAKHLEAGRFNQAASLFNKLDPVGIQKYAAGQIMKAGKTMTKEQSQQLVHMAKKLQSMPDGEEKQAMMQEMFNVIGKARGSGMTDKIIALWKSGLLSGPVTTTGNLASNTSKAIVKKLVDDPLSAVYDLGFRLLTGKRTKTFTYRGEGQGLKEGTIRGGKFMKTGVDIRNPIDKFDEKQVYFSDHWYGKTAQKYSDTIFRWMGAQDQPYFYASLRNNLYDMAQAEAKNSHVPLGKARDKFLKNWIDNAPDDKMAQAMEEARQSVFANKTVLSQLAARVNQSPNPAVKAIGNFLMPFSKVPSSVAMEIMDRTPVGVAKEVVKQIYNAKKLGTGFDQRAMSQALGKSTTGTIGLMGAGFALQGAGLMTLAMPTSDAEKNQWELEGKQPYSIKVGNNWLSTNYIQPFGSLVAMGAQFRKSLDDPKEGGAGNALVAAAFAGAQSVTQQTFLKGVGSALSALTDPSNAESWLNQTAGSLIPNALATTARAIDPLQRQINGPVDAIASRIPVVRENLLPKLNVFGQEIARPSSALNTFLNPLKPSQVLNTPFSDELARLASVDQAVLPASFNKNTFKGGKLTPEQVNELTKMVGPETMSTWQSIIADPRYASLSDEDKAKALKNAYSAISQGNRYTFAQQNGLSFTEYNKLSGDTKRYLNGETIGIKDEKAPKTTKAKVARRNGRRSGGGRSGGSRTTSTKVLNPRQYALKLSVGSIAKPKVGLKSTASSSGTKRVAIAKPTVTINKSLV